MIRLSSAGRGRTLLAAALVGAVAWWGAGRPVPPAAGAPSPAVEPLAGAVVQRATRNGVSVELAVAPNDAGRGLVASAPARFRVTLTDATTGQPLTAARPAAWVAAKVDGPAEPEADRLARRVVGFARGSPAEAADVDLNAFYAVAMNGDATLSVLAPLSGFGGSKLLDLVLLPGVADDWALDAAHHRLYVACGAAGCVVEVDTNTWAVARRADNLGPVRRLAVQPDGHTLWAAADGPSPAAVPIPVDSFRPGRPIAVGAGPHEFAFDRDSRHAFVACREAGTVEVIACATGVKLSPLRVVARPTGAAYSSASGAVYVSDAAAGGIAVVDADTYTARTRIATPAGLGPIRFAPGGRWGFMVVPDANRVLVVDAAADKVVQTITVDRQPDQVTFTDRFAYVRHRGSASVVLVPLDRPGDPAGPPAVFDVPCGRAPFGPATTPAVGVVQAAGEAAALVANPADKTIYYYAEGMAAPKGGFSNYGRTPRAVLAVERNLRTVAPGVFETVAPLPRAGGYETIVTLDSPRVTLAFDLTVAPAPAPPTPPPAGVAMAADAPLVAGTPGTVRFRITRGQERTPVSAADVVVLAYTPGVWQARQAVAEAEPGVYVMTFQPPAAGLYYFYLESRSAGLAMNDPRQLTQVVQEKGR